MRKKRITCAAAIAFAIVVTFGSTAVSASSVVLRKESRGSEVASLQRDLIKLGYLSSDVTGYYGDLTEAATKKVQREYGYKADGIAGEITLSLLDRLLGRDKKQAGSLLREGDKNSHVTQLQKNLIKLGYLNTNATGYFGPATKAAVIKLQKEYDYAVDGIAGNATLSLVSQLVSGKKVVAASDNTSTSSGAVNPSDTSVTATDGITMAIEKTGTGQNIVTTEAGEDVAVFAEGSQEKKETVEETDNEAEKKTQDHYLLKWFGNVEKIFPRGSTATVYDIKTEKSFKIKRTYGTNHADCETLTKEDTATMKKIYSGVWSWERRAVIVIVSDFKIAACMTGYPHAGMDKYTANRTISSRSGGYGRGTNLDTVKGNNMDGVFDIHFLGSKNHYNNKIDPKHQALVKEAAKWAEENY